MCVCDDIFHVCIQNAKKQWQSTKSRQIIKRDTGWTFDGKFDDVNVKNIQ